MTQNPSSHPKLHVFLQRVCGFDSVDDESKPERRTYKKYPKPSDWNIHLNPPYSYWLYYMFANMAQLNNWRRELGYNTFTLRPHAVRRACSRSSFMRIGGSRGYRSFDQRLPDIAEHCSRDSLAESTCSPVSVLSRPSGYDAFLRKIDTSRTAHVATVE